MLEMPHKEVMFKSKHKLDFGFVSMDQRWVPLDMDFLIDGQISCFCPDQHGGEAFNPNNVTQTHSIFVKL